MAGDSLPRSDFKLKEHLKTMVYIAPASALIICAALYIFENKVKRKKWICSIAVIILHIFVIIYFLFAELNMEMLLLFLLASLALALSVSVRPPKE